MKTSAATKISSHQRCALAVRKGPDKGVRFELKPPRVSIGRSDDCDIPLKDPRVSRLQANIEFRSDAVYIIDVSSRDNLFLNDELVVEASLSDGDLIQMGDSEIQFQVEELTENAQAEDFGKASDSTNQHAHPSGRPGKGQLGRDDQAATDRNRNSVLAASSKSPLVPFSPQAPISSSKQGSSRLPGISRGGPPSNARDMQPPGAIDPQLYQQPRPSRSQVSQGDAKIVRFYIVILIVGGLLTWLLTSNTIKSDADPGLRTSEQIAAEIKSSEERLEVIAKQREFKTPEEKTRYEEANNHYLQGFRDFQKRNFSRAMRSFETARAIDPGHEMAKRYYQLAARKRDEFIAQSLHEGRRYKEKNMHARCVSSLQSALKTLGDSVSEQDLREKEIKALLQECDALAKARF